jgi:hypothetical protein
MRLCVCVCVRARACVCVHKHTHARARTHTLMYIYIHMYHLTRVTLNATHARAPTPPHRPGNGADDEFRNCSAVRRPPPKSGELMSIDKSVRPSLLGTGRAGAGDRVMVTVQ